MATNIADELRKDPTMQTFLITVSRAGYPTITEEVVGHDIREVTMMFWTMWIQPDMPDRVDIEERTYRRTRLS